MVVAESLWRNQEYSSAAITKMTGISAARLRRKLGNRDLEPARSLRKKESDVRKMTTYEVEETARRILKRERAAAKSRTA